MRSSQIPAALADVRKVAGWANQRLKGLNIGMMTGPGAASIFKVAHNGASDLASAAAGPNPLLDTAELMGATQDGDGNSLVFIGSTEACDFLGGPGTCSGQKLFTPNTGDVIKFVYDWDFPVGESKEYRNPAAVVRAGGQRTRHSSVFLTPTEIPHSGGFTFHLTASASRSGMKST